MNISKYIKVGKLVSKVKNGDMQAFSELYSLTYQKVYFLSLSILKDKLMAEDATQEVFITALDSIDKLENPKLFLAWINKITYNYCINELAKVQKRGETNSETIYPLICDDSKDNNPLESCISGENNNELMNLINKLSSKHSTVLVLKYFEELKISEIADILNVSEGTVKSRLNNAKKNLHKLYVEENGKSKRIFVFLLYPLFKKASNDNMLSYYSSKNIFDNLFSAISNNIKFKPSSEYKIAPYTQLLMSSSSAQVFTAVTSTLICTYGISTYVLDTNSNNLDFDQSLRNNTIILDKQSRSKDTIQSDMNVLDNYNDNDIDIFISDMSKPTNKPVFVDVKLAKKSIVDDMYIEKSNGSKVLGSYISPSIYRFKISENDEYNLFIKLKNNDSIVKNFKVSCIDTNGPDIVDYNFTNNELTIKLKDYISSIEFNKISLVDSEGKPVAIKSINKNTSTVVLLVENQTLYLTIPDNAGNKITYSIKNL